MALETALRLRQKFALKGKRERRGSSEKQLRLSAYFCTLLRAQYAFYLSGFIRFVAFNLYSR
ncbi:hypothetical protein ACI00D_000351 [Cronobacter dublinensis]|nr:hypothetical protein [Cronobacter dublinensis]